MDIREATKFGFQEYLVENTDVSAAELMYQALDIDYRRLENTDVSAAELMYQALDIDYRRLSYQFPNGYVASVLVVDDIYEIICEIPSINNKIMGSLNIQEVRKTLEEIYNLPIRTINDRGSNGHPRSD